MSKYYTWNQSSKKCQQRKQGKSVSGWPNVYSSDTNGRINQFIQHDECFYLRLPLVNAQTFEQLRNINGDLCGCYRETC